MILRGLVSCCIEIKFPLISYLAKKVFKLEGEEKTEVAALGSKSNMPCVEPTKLSLLGERKEIERFLIAPKVTLLIASMRLAQTKFPLLSYFTRA